jgi:hypothetical protein
MIWSYMKQTTSNRVTVGPLDRDMDVISVKSLAINIVLFSPGKTCSTSQKLSRTSTTVKTISCRMLCSPRRMFNAKPSSAPGPDKIWPRVLQRLAATLCIPLAIIFSTFMAEGSVSPDWNLANVTPIFKKGSKGDPANYRPVSLTLVCCKVMESIIRDTIVEHLTKYQLIRQSQHGFVNARNTQTNLLEYMEKLTKLMDEGHNFYVIFCDVSKGVDVVPQRRVLDKCDGMGIRGNVLWRV